MFLIVAARCFSSQQHPVTEKDEEFNKRRAETEADPDSRSTNTQSHRSKGGLWVRSWKVYKDLVQRLV